jgi:hypothetical protein
LSSYFSDVQGFYSPLFKPKLTREKLRVDLIRFGSSTAIYLPHETGVKLNHVKASASGLRSPEAVPLAAGFGDGSGVPKKAKTG